LKKDEFVSECSDLDDIIVFTKAGHMKVVKNADKVFVGKDIIHVAVFRKNDDRTTYNMIYADGKTGISYAKRFNVTGVTRDKDYDLCKGEKSKVHYFTANPNGEAEVVTILLSPNSAARNKSFDFAFENLAIKSRSAQGNQVTKYPIRSVKLKEKGLSTLSGLKIWLDDAIGRLNTDERGIYIGSFENGDRIIAFYSDGSYELTDYELSNRYDPDTLVLIEKFDPEKIITAVYYDADKEQYNVKRFRIETQTLNNKFTFIKEGKNNRLELVTTRQSHLQATLITGKKRSDAKKTEVDLGQVADITGWKAVGNKLCGKEFNSLELLPEPEEEKDEEGARQGELF
jgi:topoisomerase-4 subunit A